MSRGLATGLIVLGVIVLIVLVVFGISAGQYNKLVTLRETVGEKWSQVENVYQRRMDLIPNLVETVKGYAKHEKETLQSVVEARSKAMQTRIDAGDLNNVNKLKSFMKAQKGLSSALSRLMVLVERYPDLKASKNFLALQSQLEGTENRISVERKRYNEAVRNYNTTIKHFPTNIMASIFGFQEVAYFKAEKGAEEAPKVSF